MPSFFEHEALAIATYVREEKGQWVVYAEVTFPDVVRRFRINAYRTQRRAEIAATWIKRGADRPLKGPPLGF
ncbi:AP2 domain-containing protein [Rhodocaloribacter sp.]